MNNLFNIHKILISNQTNSKWNDWNRIDLVSKKQKKLRWQKKNYFHFENKQIGKE